MFKIKGSLMKDFYPNIYVSVIVSIDAENDFSVFLEKLTAQSFIYMEVFFCFRNKNIDCLNIFKDTCQNNKNYHFFLKEKNTSVRTFINNIVAKTSGKYIFFMSSNDILELDAIEKLYNNAVATASDVVFCGFDEMDKNSNKIIFKQQQKFQLPIDKKNFSINDNLEFFSNLTYPFVSNTLYKKDFLLKHSLHKHFCLFDKINLMAAYAYIKEGTFSCLYKILLHHYSSSTDFELNWKEILLCLIQFEYFLNKTGKYVLLEQSFINMLADVVNKLISMREPYATYFRIQMINEIIPYFRLDTFEEGYFFKKENFELIKSLQHNKQLFLDFKRNTEEIKRTVIPIVFITNSREELYDAAITIQSIFYLEDKNCFYDIYLLNCVTDTKLLETIEKLSKENIRVKIINTFDKLSDRVSIFTQKCPELRLFSISNVLSGYKKIIFLHGTLIVNHSLFELFNQNMGSNVLMGVTAGGEISYIEDKLDLLYETYISTDVMLINLSVFLDDYTAVQHDLEISQNVYLYPFQDVINTVYKNRISILNNLWNTKYSFLKEASINFKDIRIFNFEQTNPQLYPQINLAETWWTYARKLSFYEDILMFNLQKRIKLSQTKTAFATSQPKVTEVKANPKKIIPTAIKKEILLSQEEIISLKLEYIKEAFHYIFSIGSKRAMHKERLSLIEKKLSN